MLINRDLRPTICWHSSKFSIQTMKKLYRSLIVIFCLLMTYAVYSLRNGNEKTVAISDVRSGLTKDTVEETRPGYLKFRGEWINTEYPHVLDVIRKLMVEPSKEPYNLTSGNNLSAMEYLLTQKNEPWIEVAILMETLLPKGQPKYFLECGANNGETFANTLYLEKYRNWTGLLIEADPIYFAEMKSKHRKAVQVEACASPASTASIMTLHHSPYEFRLRIHTGEERTFKNPGRGYLVGYNNNTATLEPGWMYIDVLCLPIYQIMLASNMTSFDLVVLDIEGAELSVLQTIPFDKVDMKFLLVEMFMKDTKEKITAFLTSKNYTLHSFYAGVSHPTNGLFIRNDIYDINKVKKQHDLLELYELLVGDKNVSEISYQDQLNLYSVVEMSSKDD